LEQIELSRMELVSIRQKIDDRNYELSLIN